MYPTLSLRPKSDRRARHGHLWIFSNELKDGFQELEPGSLVYVRSSDNQIIGTGTVNPHSLIAVRLFSRIEEPIDTIFLRARCDSALALRTKLLDSTAACRIIFSESDSLPGLILDKFGDTLVYQSLTAGTEKLIPLILPWMIRTFNPKAVVEANDSNSRTLEGLPQIRRVVHGSLKDTSNFTLDRLSLTCDPLHGQKTGFFLDQRFNRKKLQSFIKGGETVLDLFSYTGAFGLYCLQAGASHATFVDSSSRALDLAIESANRNKFSEQVSRAEADVFEWVKDSTEQFDIVSLDPPALAKSRSKADAALRGYRDLNARAFKLVKPGGLLATSSCSGLITPEIWRTVLDEAAFKSRRSIRWLYFGTQSPDHPILSAVPETQYLKFAIASVF